MSFPEGLASPEVEIAEGGIFDNRARFADLKTMLDGNKDTQKIEAMKRIINLIAKGKDVSELFPSVVKNVAAKNVELKKLVYVYLVRYAEEKQDLALLSISTFQKALKDPNQLIRASALRVLSSIRVGMISPIMLLAIKDSVRDMSPYVRKVAAHAIPKLYSLDPDMEKDLVDCIDFLLADRRSLVLGSAVYAFEEICPNRYDLLHKHYRALCRALVDVDEWGQVTMINLLTRYARSQFADPELASQPDVDIALLLNSARPLLQSRNCSVVMAVTQLFYHIASKSQLSQVARALVRLLRGPREVQYVVLLNIATICERNPNMFDPFLKSFFVRSSDPSFVRELKLHVLTSLVSEANVHIILRELQTYVSMSELAGPAVEAIGRCAIRVPAVSDQCLAGLVQLISSPNDVVVCSAVVVLKRLLHAEAAVPLLTKLARLVHTMQAPAARSCVVWLVATHVEKVRHIAPDLLRILAKNFVNEHEMVKVETLKLAVKLWLMDRDNCSKLVEYVLQMARYDMSYDVRDRCRFLRKLLLDTTILSRHAEEIFNYKKPTPALSSSFKERDQLQLGTLSHVLNQRCAKYTDLPPFPEVSSDPALRREPNSPNEFKWDEEEDGEEEEESEEDENEEEEEEDEEEEEEEGSEEDDESDEDSDEEEDEESEDVESDDESVEEVPKTKGKQARPTNNHVENSKKAAAKPEPKAMDLLLDLDFSAAGYRTLMESQAESTVTRKLLNVVEGDGLELSMSFPRTNKSQYTPLCFSVKNSTDHELKEITVSPSEDTDFTGNNMIAGLDAGCSTTLTLFVDLADSGKQREWRIAREDDPLGRTVTLEVPLGEQVQPVKITPDEAAKERGRLSGLNRHSLPLDRPLSDDNVQGLVNCYKLDTGRFSCQTRSRKDIVLISVDEKSVEVASDNAIVGKMLASHLQQIRVSGESRGSPIKQASGEANCPFCAAFSLFDHPNCTPLPKKEMSRRKQPNPRAVKDEENEPPVFKKPKEEIVEDDMLDCQLCDERLPTIAALQAHTLAKHIPQTSIECQQCEATFPTFTAFAIHMKNHITDPDENRPKLPCSRCGLIFSDLAARHSHLISHFENPVSRKRCLDCGFVALNPQALAQHSMERHLQLQHVCNICGNICDSQKEFKEHSMSHSQEILSFECTACRVAFDSRELLGIHVQLVHDREGGSSPPSEHDKERELRVLQCSVCDERCVGEDALDEHRLFSHCKVLRADSCADCGEPLTDAADFETHTRKHARDMYMHCAVCRQSLRSDTQLRLHGRFHMSSSSETPTEEDGLEQQCEICAKTLVSKEQLLVHVLEHDAVRGCPYCPRTFGLAHQLLTHVAENHSDEQPQFCCSICGDRFQFQIQHEAHRMSHGPSMTEECSTPVSFSCSHCSKVFTSVTSLQSHAASHREGIVRRCPVCSLSFNTLSRYENHVRKHANTSSCICQICGAGFTRRDELDQHMRVHKGNLELGRHRH